MAHLGSSKMICWLHNSSSHQNYVYIYIYIYIIPRESCTKNFWRLRYPWVRTVPFPKNGAASQTRRKGFSRTFKNFQELSTWWNGLGFWMFTRVDFDRKYVRLRNTVLFPKWKGHYTGDQIENKKLIKTQSLLTSSVAILVSKANPSSSHYNLLGITTRHRLNTNSTEGIYPSNPATSSIFPLSHQHFISLSILTRLLESRGSQLISVIETEEENGLGYSQILTK